MVTIDELRSAIRQAAFFGFEVSAAAGREPILTRSKLERRFFRICHRHRLPEPEVNARVGDHEVDFLWRGRKLIVETDGYRFHRGPVAFEDDRGRDVQLKLLGYEVVRFTYRQVVNEPAEIARTLRALLA